MNTSNLLVQELKDTYQLASDYAVAKKLHITDQAIRSMIKRGGQFSDKSILKVAKLLNRSPYLIWLKIQSEQLKDNENDLIDADLLDELPQALVNAESLDTIEKPLLADILTKAEKSLNSPTEKEMIKRLRYILW